LPGGRQRQVGRGGDQGRDFETFRSFIRDAVDRGFAAVEPIGRLAFTCTIQQAKIRGDVKRSWPECL
jgi:hypothetical protein